MEGAFVQYYEGLFTSSDIGDMRECLRAVKKKVSPEMNANLLKEFNMAEVSAAMHQMPLLKAPGPYCFFADFFQKN